MKTRVLSVRMNAEELAELARQAQAAGLGVSAWVRHALGLAPLRVGGRREGAGRPPKIREKYK